MSTGSRDGSYNEDEDDDVHDHYHAGVIAYSDHESSDDGKSASKEVDIIEISSDSSSASSPNHVFVPSLRSNILLKRSSQQSGKHDHTLHAATYKSPSGTYFCVWWCACAVSLLFLKLFVFQYGSQEALFS
jgi:hypothetical protein